MNRAVALAHAEGPQAGLAILERLADDKQLQRYSPYFAALAELSLMNGERDAAREAWGKAAGLTPSEHEARFYRMRAGQG